MLNCIYFFLAILLGSLSARATVPNVVVTIKPIHSLAMGIMAGLRAPTVLYAGEASPHVQMLTPKQVRQVNTADMVIWVGPSYETQMQGIMTSLKSNQRLLTLTEEPGIILYPIRQGEMWGHCHTHAGNHCNLDDHCHESHNGLIMDGHLWLDPQNAKIIVRIITEELVQFDPENEQIYRSNAVKVTERLESLDQELQNLLMPIRGIAYLVYHDGTQYFDRHFKTNAVGVLVGDNHYGINAQHLLKISDFIRDQSIKCIFTEPQFSADMLKAILEKTRTKIKTLDYLGIGLTANDKAYFIMMRNLAQSFLEGLGEE